jgi:ribosomal protein S18 acetylase RimI-like enzyme
MRLPPVTSSAGGQISCNRKPRSTTERMKIRQAHTSDAEAIWAIIEPVIRAGETYALPRDMSKAEALEYWMGRDRETFVVEDSGALLGTYYLRRNQLGGGAHVANCGYITAASASGRGVARAMCEDSLARARERGFRAMQFNCVVSTNVRAVRLWKALGFEVVGVLPGTFCHPTQGDVDAFVMYRRLNVVGADPRG